MTELVGVQIDGIVMAIVLGVGVSIIVYSCAYFILRRVMGSKRIRRT